MIFFYSNVKLISLSCLLFQLVDEYKTPIVRDMRAFIGGYIAKHLLKSIGVCSTCRRDFITNGTSAIGTDAGLIIARSYKPSLLLQPTSNFMKIFSRCCEILHVVLPNNCLDSNLMCKLKRILKCQVGENVEALFTCHKHASLDLFLRFFVKFYVHTWIKNVNRILRGIDNGRKNVLNDKVKIMAHERFIVYSKRKAALRAAKQLV